MTKKKKIILLSAATLVLLLTVWTVWGNTALTVSEFAVASGKLPEAFSGFRIAQVSDLHNAEFGDGNKKLLQKLEKTEPDIIVITGDLVDSNRTDVDIAVDFAANAAAIAPTYYVTGNHEAGIGDYGSLKASLVRVGVTVLSGDCVTLEQNGESIVLMGVDDPSILSKNGFFDTPSEVIKDEISSLNTDDGAYTVLLSHRPELFDVYVDCGVDLVFSGHAHGGQFRLPFIGGIIAPGQGLFPEYDSGAYTENGTTMIVSRGIGNSIIPIRFNNRPEIVTVELIRE